MKQIIDLNTWDRTTHFNFFRRMDYPQYLICKNIDITNFMTQLKIRDISFYYGMIYAATYTLNKILHNTIHPSFTDMSDGSELFKMVTVDMEDNIDKFVVNAKKKADNQKDYFVIKDLQGRGDLIYITCIPWVSFTICHILFLSIETTPYLVWLGENTLKRMEKY